jgi:chorismate mutase/prephenate dehydratase
MDLDEWRSRINAIDQQILSLLNQRAEAVVQIGEAKRQLGLEFYNPEREQEILSRLRQSNAGPFPDEGIEAVWREILSACLPLERPLRIAYFGPAATFTHQAALARFGSSALLVPLRSISEVFDEVERARTDFGIVPVENSTEGTVNLTLDRFLDATALICGEIVLEVHHHLLTHAHDLGEIKLVVSHPQALAQCRQWLMAHLANVPTVEAASTAGAAERAREDPSVAAVAGKLAARLYALPILQHRIEDNPNNSTRFLILGNRPMPPSGKDKTSILCSIRDEVGTLYKMLDPFARQAINLTKIESRPAKLRNWEYVFFLDFEGHQDHPTVKAVLSDLAQHCLFLKVLGSYPMS